MKATVVQIKNNKAAVLTGDGAIRLVQNNQYRVGQVITVKKKNIATMIAAAAAVVLCTVGAGAYAYNTPYSTVSLDVNPSLELWLNRFDRVIEVVHFNEDAAKVIASVELKNKRTEQAIETLAKAILDSGYLADHEGGVVVTVGAANQVKAQQLAEKLEQQVRNTIAEQLGEDAEVEIESEAVGAGRVEQAHALGLTPGKLNLLEKLAVSADEELDEDFIEKWADASVKNIMTANKLSRIDLKHVEKEIGKLEQEMDKNERKGVDNAILEELLDGLNDRLDRQPDATPVNAEETDSSDNAVAKKEKNPPKDEKDEKDEEPANTNKPEKQPKPTPSPTPKPEKEEKLPNPNKPSKDTPKPSNPNKPEKQEK